MNNNPVFHYAGHSFQGVRLFNQNEDFHAITKNLYSPVSLDNVWNWTDFFIVAEEVSSENFDVFLMDSRYEVLPAHNNLFIWGEAADNSYKAAQHFISQTEILSSQISLIRKESIQLIKKLMKDFNLSDIYISTIEESLVHVSFKSEGVTTEIVRRVFLNDEKLTFETYNGLFDERQVGDGLGEALERIKKRLFNVSRKIKTMKETDIQEKMTLLFEQYCNETGKEPEYANCMVIFEYDDEPMEKTFKLDCGASEDEGDDGVFYYCNGLYALKGLTEKGPGTDFYIVDILRFF